LLLEKTKSSIPILPGSIFLQPILIYTQGLGDLPTITYQMTANIYQSLGKRFQFIHHTPFPIIIYGDPILFNQTNVIAELLPEEVGGFTELFKNRVVVPFSGSYYEFNHVIHHEMLHSTRAAAISRESGHSICSASWKDFRNISLRVGMLNPTYSS
jgi:hypothetical protein